MRSMTGYSYAEFQDDNIRLSAELKSYNNRFLDISVSAPPALQGAENAIRKYLGDRIARGKVEFYLKIKTLSSQLKVDVDEGAVFAYLDAFNRVKELSGVKDEISLSQLLRADGVLNRDSELDPAIFDKYVFPLLEKVYAEYDATCLREGENTKADILRHLSIIVENVKAVEAQSARFEELLRKNVYDRFQQMLGDNMDESRVYTETAVLLIKYTINEELVRLKSHLEAFHAALDSDEPVGKKLDFICQELNREINTIGSKSMMVEVDRAVVTLKDALENIREQVRNVV
ncbi:MAG: YicC family protein [Spirochaetia bacterium]|nr:YicC family protein [Spirochaetia bacterium]